MTTDPLADQLAALCDAHRALAPAVFASVGAGGDVDAAFDDAAAVAGNEHGFTGVHPSLASADATSVHVVDGARPLPAPAAALALADALDTGLEPGVVHAWPLTAGSAFTRRRGRVTLTDTGVVPPAPGRLAVVPGDLRAAIEAELAAQGAALAPGEVIESIDVVRARARYKPVVEVFRTKAVSSFALLDPATGTLVATGFATAGLARRDAVARAKAGALSTAGPDPELAVLDVVKVTGREDGRPLIRVGRARVASTIVVKLVVLSEKNPAKTRTTGWLFAGTDPVAALEPHEVTDDASLGASDSGEA